MCLRLYVDDVCTVHIIRLKRERKKSKKKKRNTKIYEENRMKCIHTEPFTISANVIYRITCRPWAFDQEIHRKTNHLGAKTNQEETKFCSEI